MHDVLFGPNMLSKGEFDIDIRDDGVEVWVTQMGDFMNMNTAFIDRQSKIVAIIDPFNTELWITELKKEGLEPTHLLYTHTHRDHTYGYSEMINNFPGIEVLGHEEAKVPYLLGDGLFNKVDFTTTWNNPPNSTLEWNMGKIHLHITHSPGHAPGHITFHGHGVYHAGDLLFTAHSGRVDLPGSDPVAQMNSLSFADKLLNELPPEWRLIPGHRYDWIDGTTPDWVSIEEILKYNFSLNDVRSKN